MIERFLNFILWLEKQLGPGLYDAYIYGYSPINRYSCY
jgi:hypothetical protein